MAGGFVCNNCIFYQERLGLIHTRQVCNAPDHGGRPVAADHPACDDFLPISRPSADNILGLTVPQDQVGRGSTRRELERRGIAGAEALREGKAMPAPPTASHTSGREARGSNSDARTARRDASAAASAGLTIACDVHTHTLFSRHAYSTIEENVRAAHEAGMELLASTDHYSSMVSPKVDGSWDIRDFQFFINYSCWPRRWHGIQLLHGAEADIVDLDGHLFGYDSAVRQGITGEPYRSDMSLLERISAECNFLIASFHGTAFTRGATLVQTTSAYLNALANPKVLILGHIGRSDVPFDMDEVLLAAKERGKLIEINETTLSGYREAPRRCRAIAERCAELGVMISTGSDAHISSAIGRFDATQAMLEEIHFPQKLIATRSARTFLDAMGQALG